MSDTQLLAIALACMWIGGYATGRGRPVHCLVIWADWQFSYRPRRSARFWIAAPIVLLAAAALWTLHPWRTAAIRRAWRRHPDRRPAPAPTYDPQWAAHRRGHHANGDI